MPSRLGKLPWFILAPAVIAGVVAFSVAGNILVGVYFERTTVVEANPLAGLSLSARGDATPAAPSPTARPATPLTAESTPSAPAAAASPGAAPTTAPPVTPATTVPPPTVPAPTSTRESGAALLLQGSFRDGAPGHHGSGIAKIGRDTSGKLVLVVENFSVTNGPDLRVILGPSPTGGGSGLDLGKLKATDGTFSYAIPDGTDLSQFKSVTIWCKSFPTIFAYATLEGV